MSSFLCDFEAAHHTVAATDCERVSGVAEITGEGGSTKVVDPITWLEEGVSIEHFDFIGSASSCDDQVVGVLLELSGIQLHGLLGG